MGRDLEEVLPLVARPGLAVTRATVLLGRHTLAEARP